MLIRLADKIINIEHLHGYTEDLCRDYVIDSADGVAADMNVSISQDDIDFERDRSEREDIAEGRPVRKFPDDYLEGLAVYRKIAEQMPRFDTFLFHGSAVAVDGEAYIFAAKSGTGKSTHVRLWKELFGDKAVIVNDDKPLIRIADDGAFVYGTPWDGKHRLSSNICVPVKAVCILKRGVENRIDTLDPAQAMPVLIQQSYRPGDPAALADTLTLIDRMAERIRLYGMECNMDPEAAKMSYERMRI